MTNKIHVLFLRNSIVCKYEFGGLTLHATGTKPQETLSLLQPKPPGQVSLLPE